ncbi:hypothetical protein NM208_g2562 [Fusarium decemcellulare]|uniref:Uncharacterized protein n=1 Tax=Fusarium decemcellulare TaxID=57161 RepID=A0ACC1SSE9_9HYPO|nr:hypothetical protein NM208_g2562 [Fusarium decemcellulare]
MSESILRLRSRFPGGNAREPHTHDDTLSPMWFYIPFLYNALKLVRPVGCVALALGYKPSLLLLLGWALTDGMSLHGRGVPRIIRLMLGMYDVLNMILILAFFADWSLSSTVQFGKTFSERRTPEEELTTTTQEGLSPAPWLYSMLRIHARCTLAVVAYTTLAHSQLRLSTPKRKALNTNQKSGCRANETSTDQLLSPYLSRLRQLVESYLQQELDRAQHSMIEELASELAYSQPGGIEICLDVDSTWIDTLKCFIENSTLESWDWWPFQPPMRPPTAGYSCIRWLCICGKPRWANVPDAFATQLVTIVKNAANGSEPVEASRGIRPSPAGSSTTATQAGIGSSIPLQVPQSRLTTTESREPRARITNTNPGAIPMPVTSRFVLFMAKVFVKIEARLLETKRTAQKHIRIVVLFTL